MFDQTILILPLGLLPFIFILAYLFFNGAENSLQNNIGSKFRRGTTEYPTVASLLLCGENENKIEFSDDGKSIILNIYSPHKNINNAVSAKEYFKEITGYRDEQFDEDLIDHHIVTSIFHDEANNIYRLTLTLPDEIVRSYEYIEHEICNVGRVFKRNNAPGNSMRWLLWPQGERRVLRKDGKLLVYIDRLQIVPGVLGEKRIIMSEKQITRNIKNRLWNRLEVKCVSLEGITYCGEIIGC